MSILYNKNMAKVFCLFLSFCCWQIISLATSTTTFAQTHSQTATETPAQTSAQQSKQNEPIETRTLWLYITQTKEGGKITYKRNGRYLKSGLKKLNYLLRDFRQNESVKMDPELFDLLWQVYRKSGSKRAIHVVSGYRSVKTNNLLRKKGHKVATHSKHLTGKAIDFYLPDVPIKRLQVLGLREHKGGVGYYKNSFVHLDTGGVRHWPALSKRQLTKVFPQGRTIHLPKNKKPLKNYEIADANLRKGLFYDGRQDIDNNPQSLISRLLGLDNSDPIDDDIEIALAESLAENIPQDNFDTSDEVIYSASLANVKTIPTPTKRPQAVDPLVSETLVSKTPFSENQINILLDNNELLNQQPETITAYTAIDSQINIPIPATNPATIPLPTTRPVIEPQVKIYQPFLPLKYSKTNNKIKISPVNLTSENVKNWLFAGKKISQQRPKLYAANFNANLLPATNLKIAINKNLPTVNNIAYNNNNENGE